MTSERTIYVDHSVVSYEAWWSDLKSVLSSKNLRLVLSIWNLYEIGSASDNAQKERRLTFLESFSPQWIVERRDIQRQEVEGFLWHHRFGVQTKEILAVTPSLSVVASFFTGAQIEIGLTARKFIGQLDYDLLRPLRRLTPDALKVWQAADSVTRKAKEYEIFDAWIRPSIPTRDPDGRALTREQQAELLMFCRQNKAAFLSECRSLAVEDALSAARTGDARRNPGESDGPDLQHAAIALPYCDVFLSRDRYQVWCAESAHAALKPMTLARVCAQLGNL